MIESLFSSLYHAMTQNFALAIAASLAWGVLSVLLSPCHLASIPLVIGFIMQQDKKSTPRAFLLSLVFSSGILFSIAVIGVVTASLGRLMGDLGKIGNIAGAVVFFIVGLHLLDIIRLDWSPGSRSTQHRGVWAALFLGLMFGFALGPCTFAYLAPVLGIAFGRSQTDFLGAVLLILAFAIGHVSVILFFGTLAQKVQAYLDWSNKSRGLQWVKRACGVLVMLGGVYLVLG